MTALSLILSFSVGIALGLFFYGGLWYTVQRISVTPHPVVFTVGSFWLRTAVAITGIWFIGNGHWENLLGCLAGFVVARPLVEPFARSFQSRLRARIPAESRDCKERADS